MPKYAITYSLEITEGGQQQIITGYYCSNKSWTPISVHPEIRTFATKEEADLFIEKISTEFLDEVRQNLGLDFDPSRLSVKILLSQIPRKLG